MRRKADRLRLRVRGKPEALVPSHPIGCIVGKTGAALHCIRFPKLQQRRSAMKVKDRDA